MKKFFSQHSVDLYFVLAPTIFVLSLLYFMPAQVPGHMDLLGNINRWGGSRGGWLFVGFLFSYLTLVAWFAGKKFGGVVSIISSAAMLFLYLHWALMLLGIMYVTPGATNIYALEWDLGKRAVGTLVPIFTLCGMVIHKAKPNWLVGLRTSCCLSRNLAGSFSPPMAGEFMRQSANHATILTSTNRAAHAKRCG